MKNLKSTLSIFIIAIYLANILGYTLVYFHLKIHVKSEAISKIHNGEFEKPEIIKISKQMVLDDEVNFKMIDEHEFFFEDKISAINWLSIFSFF